MAKAKSKTKPKTNSPKLKFKCEHCKGELFRSDIVGVQPNEVILAKCSSCSKLTIHPLKEEMELQFLKWTENTAKEIRDSKKKK